MKRFFWAICLIFAGLISLHADEYVVYSGSAYQYNEFLKGFSDAKFLIKYSDDEEVFYLYTSDVFNKAWINISSEDLEKTRKTIGKYLDWVKIATEKQVEIDKEIPESEIQTSISWKFGDDWYSSDSFKLNFHAFSQNIQRHQLVISSNKVESDRNEFVSIKLDTLYLDQDQAAEFLSGIDPETVKKIIAEHDSKQKNQELFN